MIEKMKKVSVLVKRDEVIPSLNMLRKAGVMHITEMGNRRSEEIERTEHLLHMFDRVIQAIPQDNDRKATVRQRKIKATQELNAINEVIKLVQSLDSLLQRKREFSDMINDFRTTTARVEQWGDFSPESIEFLHDNGITIIPAEVPNKQELLEKLQLDFIVVARSKKVVKLVFINVREDEVPENCLIFRYPKLSLSEMEREVLILEDSIRNIEERFAAEAAALPYLADTREVIATEHELKSVQENMHVDGPVAWLTGYIPATDVDSFRAIAKDAAWGVVIDDPDSEDAVPTKLKNNYLVRMIRPVFSLLGTIPGYREYDVSMFFLLFFIVFTAMIIGDAGYGTLFLAVAIGMHIKRRKADELVRLLYVLSGATIIWGGITGTWFSSKLLAETPFFSQFVIREIASFPELFQMDSQAVSETVMYICFILGVIQLSLACIINFIRELPALKAVAQLGWLVLMIGMYALALDLVLGRPFPFWGSYAIGGGLGAIIVFGEQRSGRNFFKGLLLGVAGLFTTFLDSISSFSNIISYIRLFAVGMSSVAIASSFNNIASSFPGGIAVIGAVLILLVGHGLNVVMGLLSVIVHGVRLNMLEFSGQMGMEWSGFAYRPLKEYTSKFFADIYEH